MIEIDFSSATMSVDSNGAIPAVTVGQRFASIHLTRGFKSPETKPSENDPAFKITGEVDLFVDTRAEADAVVNSWTFNFIQVCTIKAFSTIWSGRTNHEGEVTLDQASPPALPKERRTSLDSAPRKDPFAEYLSPPGSTIFRPQNGKIKVHIVTSMGDHPNARNLIRPVQNRVTRSPNFMRILQEDSDFVTVFVARDDKRVFQLPLAHISWNLRREAWFRWPHGKIDAAMRSSNLDFTPFVRGGPSDPIVKAIVSSPDPPFTKDVQNEVAKQAILNHLNLDESAKRSLLIPKDFF